MGFACTSALYRLRDRADLLCLLAIAVAWFAGNLVGGLWMDEVKFLRASQGMLHGFFYGNPTHMHAPVGKYAFAVSQALLGPTVVGGRIVGVVFGLATLTVFYEVVRWQFSRLAAIASTALLLTSGQFAALTTTALLDGPLTFFVTALVALILLWLRNLEPNLLTLVGGTTVLVGATKLQGGIFVMVSIFILAAVIVTESSDPSKLIARFRSYATGLLATGFIVYFPYVFVSHPGNYGGYDLPAVAETVLSVPGIGNVAYIFAASIAQNFGHIESGHSVIVAGTAYTNPPFWTYVYWFYEHGAYVYLFGFVSMFLYPIVQLWSGVDASRRRMVLGTTALTFISFLLHSLVSVKSFRYMLPFYPLFLLCIIGTITPVVERLGGALTSPSSPQVESTKPILVVALLVSMAIVAPALGVGTTIRSDSGYDDASRVVTEYAVTEADQPFVVVATNPLILRWYLGDRRAETFDFDPDEPTAFDIDGDAGTDVTVIGVSDGETNEWNQTAKILEQHHVCFVIDGSVPQGKQQNPLYAQMQARALDAKYFLRWEKDGRELGQLGVFRTC